LLARLPPERFSAELQRTTVETNTSVCTTLDELATGLVMLRDELVSVAGEDGLGVASVGTPPLASKDDFELTASGRFGRMHEDYRLLVDEQLICGTQVHVGVDDRDMAVQVAQRVSRDLPLLLALSASSPFWHGVDTGYASIRTIIWQRWPSSGTTGPLSSAEDYKTLVADLISTGVIADAKMAYFDVRPSWHVPTVELRICDACPLVDDVVMIAGLFRALVSATEDAVGRGEPMVAVAPPLQRAAMWRAARSGLDGGLLDDALRPKPIPAAEAIRGLVSRLRPQLEAIGDWDTVVELSEACLSRGNSADRQRAVFAEHGSLSEVVESVVAETQGSSAGPLASGAVLRRYPMRAGDEAFMANGQPRPAHRGIVEAIEDLGMNGLADRSAHRDRWLTSEGMTFGVDGDHQAFPVDLIPRVISAHEWRMLDAGLTQRARALELFLEDVYGDAELLDDAVLPPEVVFHSPGWRDEARTLPSDVPRAPVIGFDLVRSELGKWRVLEDNVRVPSGAGFAFGLRQVMDEVMPDLARPAGLLDAHTFPALLRRTLVAHHGSGGDTVALLSDGTADSAWFEHRLLAERAGFLLVGADELCVEEGFVVAGKGVEKARIGVLYLRVDAELADVHHSTGSPIGAALLAAASAGTVTLANAPGNGVADDKAMYCYVPDLIAYYLNERPLIDSVSTYRCRDPEELMEVLERTGELVTKPVDGYGGMGVMIGPAASAAEVARRRTEIATNPDGWVAQELVWLSSHPTYTGNDLEPRHVDLRAFVYLRGTGPGQVELADLALTRVAPHGSMVVNSSRGGGAKDTWILGDVAMAGP